MNKAIVIGSGFGGLAAALRLLKKGYQVTILERMDQAGGRAAVFKQDGFTFDAGPTVITAPYLLDELYGLFDKDSRDYFKLLPIDPFYRIRFNDGSEFDYVGAEDRLLEQIKKLSPEDVNGYKELVEHVKKIFEIGYTQLADQPFDSLASMLRVVPDMIRLENYKSVYSLVSRYIKDERLRQAFSFEPLLVGGNPHNVTSIYLLIHWLERKWGVHFVEGGTTALVKGLVQLFTEQGGQILYSQSVDHLHIESGKVKGVRTQAGQYYPADIVVSNADPVQVYSKMVEPQWRKKHSDRSLYAKKQSMSLFVWYFGTKKQYPHLAHHTILLGPRYKDLLTDIFNKKVLSEDFSLYLHAPTRTDQSMAPEGCECFYVLSPVPNNLSGIDWQSEAEAYKQKIMAYLEKDLLPDLSNNIVTEKYITPDYFENQLQSTHGSSFGIEPLLTQSAYFRFHNQSEDVNGLYFVGANTHPGAGVPGVLNSAKVLDKMIQPLPGRL